MSRFFICYDFLNLYQDIRSSLWCTVQVVYFRWFCEKHIFPKFGKLYLSNKTSERQNKICLRNAIPFSFFHILLLFKCKLRFQGEIAMWFQHLAQILALILFGWGGGGGGRENLWQDDQGLNFLAVTWLGLGAVQKVQEHNLNQFFHQI